MHNTLKVRDRTTGKTKDAMIDGEDYGRLKEYAYMTDKNSDEPFREEVQPDGKRPRIALKRDIMGFKLGDPRRVCYVDKNQLFDCRKSNLKVKTDGKPAAPVKIVKQSVNKTKVEKVVEEKVETKPELKLAPAPVTTTRTETTPTMIDLSKISVSKDEVKKVLFYGLIVPNLDNISVDDILEFASKTQKTKQTA